MCLPSGVPRFEPFPGIRYDPARVDLDAVVAPPYDVLSPEDREVLAGRDPHNVVVVDVPDEAEGAGRYEAAGATFRQWLADGVLVTDRDPAYYRYAMTFTDEAGASRTIAGVLGALAVTDPDAPGNDVLPHEQTTPKASTDRLDLTRATRANLSPIWGLSLAGTLAERTREPGQRLVTVTDGDGVIHQLDRIDDPARVEAIHAAVASAPVLIADGHHRYGVARQYRDERRAEGGARSGGADLTLAFVQELAEDQLVVQAIHRLVTGLDAGTDIAAVLAPSFEIADAGPVTPATLGAMTERGALCLVAPDGTGRFLVPRPGAFEGVRDLDSARLDHALAGVTHQLAFQHGVHEVLAELQTGRADWAVLLRPVTVAQIRATAGEGALMPPKSTFFWPKLRTGLLFRDVS
jgi:uncharacterized protein (DUF1015 family)